MWDFSRADGGVVGLFRSSFPSALRFCSAQQCGHGTTVPWPLNKPDDTPLSNETRAEIKRMKFPGKFVFFFSFFLRRDSLTGHMPLSLHFDLVFMDRAHGVWSANSRVDLEVKIRNRRGGGS